MSDQTMNPGRQGLASAYIVPPFTSLDARSGRWQARKSLWLERLLLKAGSGRESVKTFGGWTGDSDRNFPARAFRGSTSEFDPLLCEVLLHWFSKPGSTVVDPFSGGIVRGGVSVLTGRRYVGMDLSREQVESNKSAWEGLRESKAPEWLNGNSADWKPPEAGLILTCPPYGPLEKYSDDKADLSNAGAGFYQALASILNRCIASLAEGCFCVVVVGQWRERDGSLNCMAHKLPQLITARLYAELSLWTKAGSAPLRARQFSVSCKPVTTHQTVLVFVKGSAPKFHGSLPFEGLSAKEPVQQSLFTDRAGLT